MDASGLPVRSFFNELQFSPLFRWFWRLGFFLLGHASSVFDRQHSGYALKVSSTHIWEISEFLMPLMSSWEGVEIFNCRVIGLSPIVLDLYEDWDAKALESARRMFGLPSYAVLAGTVYRVVAWEPSNHTQPMNVHLFWAHIVGFFAVRKAKESLWGEAKLSYIDRLIHFINKRMIVYKGSKNTIKHFWFFGYWKYLLFIEFRVPVLPNYFKKRVII